MNSFLWVFAIFCGLLFLYKTFAESGATRQTLAQLQQQFIIDICDGNRLQAERLIAEKTQRYPTLDASQVLHLVYQDMLELTAEERAAAYVAPAAYGGKPVAKGTAA